MDASHRLMNLAILIATFLLRFAHGQTSFDSSIYISDKFNLALGNAQTISTPEGENYKPETVVISSVPVPGESFMNKGFVAVDQKTATFSLNGKPFYFSGTNAYYAGLLYIMKDAEVAVMAQEHASRGVSVIRAFAFSNFDSVPDAIMPKFGVYNEKALRRLDLMLAEFAKNGIRVVMTLSNFWPFLGNMQDYVDQAYPGQGAALELFYTDPVVKRKFKDYVNMLVNRKNTITGLKYSEDPTIFAWELANEPRTQPGYEKSLGLAPGTIICNWAGEMSSYIRSLDKNHMISVGDEGMRTEGNPSEPHSWLNNGYDGVSFVCNLKQKDVSFATLHAYPDSWYDMNDSRNIICYPLITRNIDAAYNENFMHL